VALAVVLASLLVSDVTAATAGLAVGSVGQLVTAALAAVGRSSFGASPLPFLPVF